MHDWARDELGGLELGDARRTERLVKTAGLLANHPGASIPHSCGSWADTEAAYRLFDNPKVSAQAILEQHYVKTAERAAQEPEVLVLTDGSEQNFTGLKETKGLGYLKGNTWGLDLQATLVASRSGQPLGLIDALFRVRDPEERGKKEQRHDKPTSEKESQVWLDALARAQEHLPADLPFLYVADAEADIFDLYAAPRRPGVHVLVRCSQPTRRVKHPEGQLRRALGAQPPAGTFTITLGRGNGRKERDAVLTLRHAKLTLLAPKHAKSPTKDEIEVWCIWALEQAPPEGQEAVSWLLVTTMPTESFEEARSRTEAYAQRWLIERYFATLKGGCRAEDLQLGTATRLERALALFCVVAWRLLWLMHEARRDPHASCDQLFSEAEWKAIYAYRYPDLPMPKKPPTLREMVRLTARLGGYLGRRNDGEPGIETLWKGLAELSRLSVLYRSLARNPALASDPTIRE